MKSKLLKTLLPIAGVAAVAAPVTCLTSCGEEKPLDVTLSLESTACEIVQGSDTITFKFLASAPIEDHEKYTIYTTFGIDSYDIIEGTTNFLDNQTIEGTYTDEIISKLVPESPAREANIFIVFYGKKETEVLRFEQRVTINVTPK